MTKGDVILYATAIAAGVYASLGEEARLHWQDMGGAEAAEAEHIRAFRAVDALADEWAKTMTSSPYPDIREAMKG